MEGGAAPFAGRNDAVTGGNPPGKAAKTVGPCVAGYSHWKASPRCRSLERDSHMLENAPAHQSSTNRNTAMAEKDFGLIENDYAFFMSHSTEAESDVAEYARQLARFVDGRALVRMLDFGCGTGEFTERLLSTLNWPAQSLELTLVEPVRHQRDDAARRLAKFSERSIAGVEVLPLENESRFDLILSNHALYYVRDLRETLRQLNQSLSPGGTFLLAIAGWENVLIELWKTGFATLGRKVPYYTAADVEAELSRVGVSFRKTQSRYQLRFSDSTENRLKILRFLFGDYLHDMPAPRLLGEFDRYVRSGHVEIDTSSDHFAIEHM